MIVSANLKILKEKIMTLYIQIQIINSFKLLLIDYFIRRENENACTRQQAKKKKK